MDSSINVVTSKEQSCSAVQDVMGSSENESEQTGTSDSSSSASSPMPMEDLGPVFEVKGIRAATDSSVLTFRISRLDEPDNKDSWWEVTRSSEEFEAFNRLIYDCQKYGGIIFPPLPPSIESKYEDNFLEAPIIHRKQVERYYFPGFLVTWQKPLNQPHVLICLNLGISSWFLLTPLWEGLKPWLISYHRLTCWPRNLAAKVFSLKLLRVLPDLPSRLKYLIETLKSFFKTNAIGQPTILSIWKPRWTPYWPWSIRKRVTQFHSTRNWLMFGQCGFFFIFHH